MAQTETGPAAGAAAGPGRAAGPEESRTSTPTETDSHWRKGEKENGQMGALATGRCLALINCTHSHTHILRYSVSHTHARSDILVAHKMLKAFIVYKGSSSSNSPRNESCSTAGE